jgi:hypothetical protein
MPVMVQAMSKKTPAHTESSSFNATSETVWVGKPDEAKSCAKERGIPLDTMASTLESNGIKVLSRKKVPDGKMRIQMCGADKGDQNGFQIARKDLDKARDLGFKPVIGGTQ